MERAGTYERSYVLAPLMDNYMIDELEKHNIGFVTFNSDGK